MDATLTIDRFEDTTEQVCSTCGAELTIVVNGSRPEVELICDCGTDRALG